MDISGRRPKHELIEDNFPDLESEFHISSVDGQS